MTVHMKLVINACKDGNFFEYSGCFASDKMAAVRCRPMRYRDSLHGDQMTTTSRKITDYLNPRLCKSGFYVMPLSAYPESRDIATQFCLCNLNYCVHMQASKSVHHKLFK